MNNGRRCIDCEYYKIIIGEHTCMRPDHITGIAISVKCKKERRKSLFDKCGVKGKYFKEKIK